MIRISELKLPLSALPVETRRAADAPAETDADRLPTPHPIEALTQLVAKALAVAPSDVHRLQVFKRSFDARKAELLAVFIADVTLASPEQELAVLQQHPANPHIQATPDMQWRPNAQAPSDFGAVLGQRPVVVGFGPCGMFAALALAQMGFRPIVLERGKTVRERTKDTWGLWRKKILTPESNVQFGEGGAGTFSDGKLYSQIKDPRFLGRKVMAEFVKAGAPEDILYAAHPHIGTFKLVKVVENIRKQIESLGGEIRFEQRVTDLYLKQGIRQVEGLEVWNQATGRSYFQPSAHVVLALGHSSRDTVRMLHRHGVSMEAKAFSIGVRIEHPQTVIDKARWGRHAGHPLLGSADYKLVHHAQNGRTVYSFCMCPGGTVVAATSEPGRVVTNGMSQYSRNERNANAGMVVGVEPADFVQKDSDWSAAFGEDDGPVLAEEARILTERGTVHPLAGIVMQRQLETRAFVAGLSTYEAPAQRVQDFLMHQASTHLGAVVPSYLPGICLTDLATVLPDYVVTAMREALPVFGRKITGYDMPDAVMTGVETRTSSPLKIPRGRDYQSTNTQGLYPAGEGASYAGGILSAGVDGIKVGEAVAEALLASFTGKRT